LKGQNHQQCGLNGSSLEKNFVLPPESGRPDWLLSLERNDRDLVCLVEELGSAAAGANAELKIIEIPDGCSRTISDVVGFEFVVVNGEVFEPRDLD
jgi:hypothetical protein